MAHIASSRAPQRHERNQYLWPGLPDRSPTDRHRTGGQSATLGRCVPLFEQDNLNVLAAFDGLTYRLRYRRKYLSDELAERWGQSLQGLTCVAHFSLQQPLQYHDAVIFPIRSGTVTHATKEAGDVYLLEFTVDGAVSLERPGLPPTA